MASDPFTELQSMAVQAHELFSAYVEAGFTEAQAMRILIAFIQGAAK